MKITWQARLKTRTEPDAASELEDNEDMTVHAKANQKSHPESNQSENGNTTRIEMETNSTSVEVTPPAPAEPPVSEAPPADSQESAARAALEQLQTALADSTAALQASEQRAAEYLEQLKRLQAEFQNFRKRVEKERNDLSIFIKADLIRKLLPSIDDFDRFAGNHADDPLLKDFNMLYNKLIAILREEGLERILATGTPFDPMIHEALHLQEAPDEDEGKVLEEWEKGYLFRGNLLRASKVKVGKKKNL
ncbi:nucleotide exchange factor GrpE [candidate division KSB1 bacterium]|nr:nucleotide exchange factor GrpE [candidate division KSB1 bacterium]